MQDAPWFTGKAKSSSIDSIFGKVVYPHKSAEALIMLILVEHHTVTLIQLSVGNTIEEAITKKRP
jgi:hypothetical protein